jgi:hypothetical protein
MENQVVRAVIAALAALSLSLGANAQNLIINDGACTVPLRASSSATIDPTTGDVRVLTDQSPICGAISGPSVQLSVSPSVVNSNESFSVSWAISPAASATCTATGGSGTTWTQTTAANFQANNGTGVRNYAITNGGTQAVNVTFTLTCTFQSGSVPAQNGTVTVNGTTGGGGCSSVVMPNTNIETSFEASFGFPGQPQFPGRIQGLAAMEISPGTNRSIRFIPRNQTGGTNDMPLFAAMNLRNEQGFDQGPISASIKACKGDFRDLGDGCNTTVNGLSNSLSWSIDPAAPSGFCKLIPGQTYYINIIHGLPPNLSQTTCPFGSCVVFYKREK